MKMINRRQLLEKISLQKLLQQALPILNYLPRITFYTFCISVVGLPSIFLRSLPKVASDNHYQRIALIEHENLNLPKSPCNDDPDYSFRTCVNSKMSAEIGCRRKWDLLTDKSLPLCTNISQFR